MPLSLGKEKNTGCMEKPQHALGIEPGLSPLFSDSADDEPCCGLPPEPASSPYERPGYKMCEFVEGFINTPVGKVPKIKTELSRRDILGTIGVRLNISRNRYTVSPGLYCVGNPNPESPVLVTANYKLSFDTLRRELESRDLWILILDTRGINVWCAAGKALFSTRELVHQIKRTRLDQVVTHRRLILPQLGATGVSSHQVKKEVGFKIIWGPISVKHLNTFLENGQKADAAMRRVTFTTWERLVLVPVELSALPKLTLWVMVIAFILSGIGSDIFSLSAAWDRGLMLAAAYLGGIIAGAVITPLLLPWIPTRTFAVKGAFAGALFGIVTALMFQCPMQGLDTWAIVMAAMAVSSFLAMNFTGSTPYTSPSGVEKEMRKAIPLQAASVLIAAILWVGSAFIQTTG